MNTSFVLPPEQVDQIEKILDELQSKTNATYVFLADISGQLIYAYGRTGDTDVVALAALTASNMAATTEMAKRIGEPARFKLLFHEGERENIYLSYVGESFLMAVVFSTGVQIGLVRLFSKRATDELAPVAATFESSLRSVAPFGDDFTSALDDELNRLLPGS